MARSGVSQFDFFLALCAGRRPDNIIVFHARSICRHPVDCDSRTAEHRAAYAM